MNKAYLVATIKTTHERGQNYMKIDHVGIYSEPHPTLGAYSFVVFEVSSTRGYGPAEEKMKLALRDYQRMGIQPYAAMAERLNLAAIP